MINDEVSVEPTRRTVEENRRVLEILLSYWKSFPESKKNKRGAVEKYFSAKRRKLVELPTDPTMFDCEIFEALGLPTDAEAFHRLNALLGKSEI